ncbi:DUF2163 domain-containing protein [Rhizobium paknamense]|uniref:Phage protein (TIGR02218 family) n=1 Tax=Rhizobium paknamense TaxID=1206817 RepID=A0ABU0I7S9_9HYPH|nr:DUF2163 domain-containing protein [Rhizobium paknamense]MDQ0454277.1 putative phage protein (TIGR02218 family) [Rhizobium paknamense]
MRKLSAAFAAHIAGEATTLCTAWRVTRTDGVVLGFTDHDRDLSFDGTVFAAASGFSASDGEAVADLSAAASEVAGAFSSAAITEADLSAGRFDGAKVEVFRVNWQAPEEHVLLKVQTIGEVSRQAGQFSAELRSFAAKLDRQQGRLFSRRCDARLGDGRCGVDMSVTGRRVVASIASVEAADRLVIAGVSGSDDGAFRHGRLSVTGGAAAGVVAEIEESLVTDAGLAVTLWLPLEVLPVAGDAVVLEIGCDRSFATCRDSFGNAANFRGFPHMPGADFAYSYVSGKTTHDGSVLFE